MKSVMVKPEFWHDSVTGELVDPEDVALFYIGLWQFCDDFGWLRWKPTEIGAALYPYATPLTRTAAVEQNGLRLVELKRVRILKCGHAEVPSYRRHQKFVASYRQSSRIRDEHDRGCGTNRTGNDRKRPVSTENDRTAAHRGEPRPTAVEESSTKTGPKTAVDRGGPRRTAANRATISPQITPYHTTRASAPDSNGAVSSRDAGYYVRHAKSRDPQVAASAISWLRSNNLNAEGEPIES